MLRAALSWLRYKTRLARLVAVAFALACQISAGAAVPMQDAAEAQSRLVTSAAIFCQSGTHPARRDGAPLHRQVPDHGLCRVLSTHSHAMAVLDDAPVLPAPATVRTGGANLPGARAPPTRSLAAAFPRGPPHPV